MEFVTLQKTRNCVNYSETHLQPATRPFSCEEQASTCGILDRFGCAASGRIPPAPSPVLSGDYSASTSLSKRRCFEWLARLTGDAPSRLARCGPDGGTSGYLGIRAFRP